MQMTKQLGFFFAFFFKCLMSQTDMNLTRKKEFYFEFGYIETQPYHI